MNSSNIYYYINNLNNTIIYTYKYILPMIYILGNIGNFISFLIFLKKSWKKNVCIFYFKFLLLFNTCYINCTILGFILINGFKINFQNSNIILCKFYFYFSLLFGTLTPTILILASIDRLLISSQNINTRLYSSKRLAYFLISISTFIWIIYHIHVIIKVNIQEIYPSYFTCYYDLSIFYLNFITYSLAIIHIIFFLLMIILCIITFKNIRHIQTITYEERRKQIRIMTKKDFQLLRCLFIQDILFINSGILLIIYYIYYAITKDQLRTILEHEIINFINKFFIFLYTIPYSTNFFVFIIISKAFRHEIKRIIYKIIGKKLHSIREEENNRQVNVMINIIPLPT